MWHAVDFKRAPNVCLVQIEEVLADENPRIVDEDVHCREISENLGGGLLYGRPVCDVTDVGLHVDPQVAYGTLCLLDGRLNKKIMHLWL